VNIALVILAALLGLVTAFSAFGKFSNNAKAVDMLHHLGLNDGQIRGLAIIEVLGALGLLVGIWIPILGLLAAIGFVLYFLGAMVMHVRSKDPMKDSAPALVLLILSIIVTILQFAR
jgi:uncharacterized membrane protein YphA (DoxX/SURF4 family)